MWTRSGTPPTITSRIRGLFLGLALGDALGSTSEQKAISGKLNAGVATQLAAWTAEGLLRSATRYGQLVVQLDLVRYAYERWVMLRAGASRAEFPHAILDLDGRTWRGWLFDVPALAEARGSSPSTLKAIRSGGPLPSSGCQGTLRALPVAGLAVARWLPDEGPRLQVLGRYGQAVCRLTHDHPRAVEATGLAVAIAGSCLTVEDGIFRAIQSVAYDPAWNTPEIVLRAFHSAQTAPGRVATLAALAPDSSGMSALAAGVYSALSFPDQDTTLAALTFAAKAPDGDSAAAMCGAFLGASHGYEALPTNYVSRLELGWVLDRLACDMALQLSENQAGPGWKTDVFHDDGLRPLDVWWEVKYPGA